MCQKDCLLLFLTEGTYSSADMAIFQAASAPTEMNTFQSLRQPSQASIHLYPCVIFATGRIFPLPWLFSLYARAPSCSLYSLTVCHLPFSRRCTGHIQSALILSTLSNSQQKPYPQPYHGETISMVSLLYPLRTRRASPNLVPILLLVSNP